MFLGIYDSSIYNTASPSSINLVYDVLETIYTLDVDLYISC